MTYARKIIALAVTAMVFGAAAHAATECDNDYYWNGVTCTQCPAPTGEWANVCNAGLYSDGEVCTDYTYGISGAGGGTCGYGNAWGDNELSSCHIYSHDADDTDYLCKYCDKTGCFVLSRGCYYES